MSKTIIDEILNTQWLDVYTPNTDKEYLKDMYDVLFEADREVAKILNISISHSILLDYIDRHEEGCPQDVISNPQVYLGPNYAKVLQFWTQLDNLTEEQLNNIVERYDNFMKKPWNDGEWIAKDVCKSAEKVTKYSWEVGYCVQLCLAILANDLYDNYYVARYATYEIMSNTENPAFLPIIEDQLKN
jgi:hypothetical protein